MLRRNTPHEETAEDAVMQVFGTKTRASDYCA